MSYPEADFIPLSALQHYLYCPRQCALIHLDRAWEENVFTGEGRILHERAHSGETESRKTVRTVTSLALSSKRLGISGVADVVEFHEGKGLWQPYPVEYKRGRPKKSDADRVQLCTGPVSGRNAGHSGSRRRAFLRPDAPAGSCPL